MTDLDSMPVADREELAELFVDYAWSMLHTPYRWGGDDPMSGLDCSGLVIECLQAVGLLPLKTDLAASGIFGKFHNDLLNPPSLPTRGCLVLYPRGGEMGHVGIYFGSGLYLTAEGGGSKTKTREDAIKANAFVKLRPVNSRKNAIFLDIFRLRET